MGTEACFASPRVLDVGRQLFQSAIKHKFPFVANMSVNRMLRQLTGAGACYHS